jgi:hypothetical protein
VRHHGRTVDKESGRQFPSLGVEQVGHAAFSVLTGLMVVRVRGWVDRFERDGILGHTHVGVDPAGV